METTQTTAPAVTEPTKLSQSERFTAMVLKEFNGNITGGLQLSDYQKQLVQGYFIRIDRALVIAEENRIAKNKNNKNRDYDNPLSCTWQNVNMHDLILDIVCYAKMGLDMMQDNHLSAVPYRNKKTDKYDITLTPGYNGIQYIAENYAIEKPTHVVVELVYETDHFKAIKRNATNKIESYEFEVNNPFARGAIIGGFGYIQYQDPTKNKLIFMPLAAILKRKPQHAAAEFWGGTAKRWVDGKQVDVELEGWKDEMYYKTLKREIYSSRNMPRDPRKVDDNYQHMKEREALIAEMNTQTEIYEKANATIIDISPDTPPHADIHNLTDYAEQPHVDGTPADTTPPSSGNGPDF